MNVVIYNIEKEIYILVYYNEDKFHGSDEEFNFR